MRLASPLRQTLTAPAQVEVRCLLKGACLRKSKGPDNRSESPFRPSSRATTAHERPCHSAAALIERSPLAARRRFVAFNFEHKVSASTAKRAGGPRPSGVTRRARRLVLEQPRPTSRASLPSTLGAVTPVTGAAQVVSSAPKVALALGYDVEAARKRGK